MATLVKRRRIGNLDKPAIRRSRFLTAKPTHHSTLPMHEVGPFTWTPFHLSFNDWGWLFSTYAAYLSDEAMEGYYLNGRVWKDWC
jgi:hypothetical protein